jgi:hypothetical protein
LDRFISMLVQGFLGGSLCGRNIAAGDGAHDCYLYFQAKEGSESAKPIFPGLYRNRLGIGMAGGTQAGPAILNRRVRGVYPPLYQLD